MNAYFFTIFRSSVSAWLFLMALCWRIRNASCLAAPQPGLSQVNVPSHQSPQYLPRDLPAENLLMYTAPSSLSTRRAAPPKLDPKTLQMVKHHFGNLFGLKERKRPAPHWSKMHVPEVMLQMYRDSLPADQRVTETEEEIVARLKAKRRKPTMASTATVTRSFLHEDVDNGHGTTVGISPPENHKEHLLFNTISIPQDDEIKAAELQLFIGQQWSVPSDPAYRSAFSPPASSSNTSSAHQNGQRLLVRVDEILSRTPDGEAITRPLDSRLVDITKKSKYVTFDITPAVQRWQGSPTENHGLEVVLLTPNGHPLVWEFFSQDGLDLHVVNPIRRRRVRRAAAINETATSTVATSTEWSSASASRQPLALVYSDDAKTVKARSKGRSPARGQSGGGQRRNQCRRYPLNVDFTDIGWNEWILAPPNYNAYFCMGECHFPLPDHLNTTNHATVQSLVHNANIGAVPKPCCVPTELSPISLLYMDEYEKIVLKNYQDMVIEGCGCR